MEEALLNLLASLDLPHDQATMDKFSLYADLVAEWNEKMNLTAIVDKDEVYQKHFIDCVLTAKSYDFSGKTVLDIGSGAGFPGLVIALIYPSAKVTLVDATAKKFIFLKEVVSRLNLTNVEFAVGRIEDRPVKLCSFDCAISRGFAMLPIFIEVASPFVKLGGTVFAMKGAKGKEEYLGAKAIMDRYGLRMASLAYETLPGGDERVNIMYRKEKATPRKYPRKWDIIVKEYKPHG